MFFVVFRSPPSDRSFTWPATPLAEHEAEAVGRDKAIRAAWRSGAYGLAEIAEHFGLHYSWVSRIANAKNKTKNKT